ncbi:hypothetical protein EGW08_008710 [Elysia chlorotica]|uniref:Tyrosine specific protein phosphatases domain-containing protein n=1 Tax=Elysia chlorotica TaxID=188477 RepID=A0A3S0ZUZ6_ELYCH|nr:hypothetical protein EGW08_008710 [Elysia chlorotica]
MTVVGHSQRHQVFDRSPFTPRVCKASVRASEPANLLHAQHSLSRPVAREATGAAREATGGMMKSRRPEPAEIVHKNMRFLITDRPTDANLEKFIMELKKHGVQDVVRVCEPTYSKETLANSGIRVLVGTHRAPVLVALALMEAGLKYEDAVEMIREKRRGAINARQLAYLEMYKAKARLRPKNGRNGGHNGCTVL